MRTNPERKQKSVKRGVEENQIIRKYKKRIKRRK
jgi:hypothetical protein